MSQLRLEDLVESLCAEGEGESLGRQFTVDRARALEKMRSFQLDNPFAYCLKWLQAAVAGSATYFAWTSDASKVRLEISGLLLRPDRLASLPYLLFEPTASPPEQHLSAGVNAVIATKARQLSIWTWDGKEGACHSWRPGQVEQKSWSSGSTTPEIVVELHRTRADSWRELWYAANNFHVGQARGSRNARDREQQMLHDFGALAPLAVSIQGAQPDFQLRLSPSIWMQLRGLSTLSNPYGFRSVESAPATVGGFSPARLCTVDGGGLCRLLIATPQVRPRYSVVYPVRDGVMLQPQNILEGRPGKIFFACCNHLRVDLSGLSIIRDENWEKLISELSARLGQ